MAYLDSTRFGLDWTVRYGAVQRGQDRIGLSYQLEKKERERERKNQSSLNKYWTLGRFQSPIR